MCKVYLISSEINNKKLYKIGYPFLYYIYYNFYTYVYDILLYILK